jgi:hypothetical protein
MYIDRENRSGFGKDPAEEARYPPDHKSNGTTFIVIINVNILCKSLYGSLLEYLLFVSE